MDEGGFMFISIRKKSICKIEQQVQREQQNFIIFCFPVEI